MPTRAKEYIVTGCIHKAVSGTEGKCSSRGACWVCDRGRCRNVNGNHGCVTCIIYPDEPAAGWLTELEGYIPIIDNCQCIITISSRYRMTCTCCKVTPVLNL